MNFYDLLLQRDVNQLGEQLNRLEREMDRADWAPPRVKELAQENLELKLRLGLLVRLLIAKGVFTAEEYAGLLAQARPRQ